MIIKWRDHLVRVGSFEAHGREMIRFMDCYAIDLSDRSSYIPYLLLKPSEFEILKASSHELRKLQEIKKGLKLPRAEGKPKPRRPRIFSWFVKLRPDEFCEVGEVKGFKAYYSYPASPPESPFQIYRVTMAAWREAEIKSFDLESWTLECRSPRPPSKVVAEIVLPDGKTWRHQLTIMEVKALD